MIKNRLHIFIALFLLICVSKVGAVELPQIEDRLQVQLFTSNLNTTVLNNEFNFKYEKVMSSKINYDFQAIYIPKDITRSETEFDKQILGVVGISYRLTNFIQNEFFNNRVGAGYVYPNRNKTQNIT
ncbi:MAG: hypothetical protein GY730_02600 [bacterium]|nr:hypothetical protein [bacterium]